MQAIVTVKLKYCIWRDGRPRFVPGAAQRAMGYVGRDLKHGDGRWFSLEDVQAFVTRLQAEIANRKIAVASGRKPPKLTLKGYLTVGQLLQAWLENARMQPGKAGKLKTLKPASIASYRKCVARLESFDPVLWDAPAAAVSPVVAHKLYMDLYQEAGLHQARAIVASCRAAWGWARLNGKLDYERGNPFRDLRMEVPKGRVKSVSAAAIRHLIATADALQRPEIGDMVALAVFTSQRQSDRLSLTGGQIRGGRMLFRQSKTGRVVECPVVPVLKVRLDAARVRRERFKVQHPQVVINETTGQPWQPDYYRHVFSDIRTHAAKTFAELADLRDQDLRDTALAWARQGGADFDKRRQLSGHSIDAAAMEERHYTGEQASHGDEAVTAIMKVWDA